MAEENQNPDPTPEENPPVTQDQLNQLERGFGEAIGGLAHQVERFIQAQANAPAVPDVRPEAPSRWQPSRDELEAAYADGRIHEVFGRMMSSEREALRHEIQSDFDGKLAQGKRAITQLTAQQAKSSMPHFDRFRDEITQVVENAQGDAAMNPETWQAAYNYVVGKNMDSLLDEAKNEVLRGGRGGANLPGAGSNQPAVDNSVPSVSEALGAETQTFLESRGLSADDWAKKFGFQGWSDYYNKRVKAKSQ